ncbi:MAG TPA: hypothetical protein VFN60_03030 [Acidimicrobiales bacterium]|nr:hypothetical protein [Acidimicrobiales bacterium]
MNVNSSHLTRLCSACLLTGATIAGAATASASPAPALAAHLALGPSVAGRATPVHLSVTDPSAVPLGRLLVSAGLPWGVAYVPGSITAHEDRAAVAIGAPRVVLAPGGQTELYWGDLPAPGHGALQLSFLVRPGARTSTYWAGSSWSVLTAVRAAPSGGAGTAGSAEGAMATVTQAGATAHVEPLAVTSSVDGSLRQVVVTGNPDGSTRDVVVRAYLPAGVHLAPCPTGTHCATPTVGAAVLPTVPGQRDEPQLHVSTHVAAGIGALGVASPIPASTTSTTASTTAPTAGTSGSASTSTSSSSASPSTAASSTTTPPTTGSAPADTTATAVDPPVSPPPTVAATPEAAAPSSAPAAGPKEHFTVLTWHLGTVRAGGRVSVRYGVHVTGAAGATGSWLVTATGSTSVDAHHEPRVLTVEHLVSWSRPRTAGVVQSPSHVPAGGTGSTSSTTNPPPDPFGSAGNGGGSGSGSGSTTTTTTPATTGTTTNPFGSASSSSATSTTSVALAGSASSSTTTPKSSGTLAYTGVNADLELEIAAVALLLGAGIVTTTRKRPSLAVAAPGGAPRKARPLHRRADDRGSRPAALHGLAAGLRHSAAVLAHPIRRLGGGDGLDGVLARDSFSTEADLDWLALLADDPAEDVFAPPPAPAPAPAVVAAPAPVAMAAPPAPAVAAAGATESPASPAPTPDRVAFDRRPAFVAAAVPASLPVPAAAVPEAAPGSSRLSDPAATTVSGVSPLVDVLVPLGGWRDGEWCFDRPLGDLLGPVFGNGGSAVADPSADR